MIDNTKTALVFAAVVGAFVLGTLSNSGAAKQQVLASAGSPFDGVFDSLLNTPSDSAGRGLYDGVLDYAAALK